MQKRYFETNKDINQKLIALISDIHYCDWSDKKRLIELRRKIIDIYPNCLVVCGDTFNQSRNLNIEPMLRWYEEISEYIPTVVSVGNHDIKYGSEGNWKEGSIEYLEEVGNINNVFLLDNSDITIDGINFIGMTNSFKYYESNEDYQIFINELEKFMLKYPNLSTDTYNILLCHSPYSLQKIDGLKQYDFFKNIDMIFSGHMHGGLAHPIMKPFLGNNRGIIAPNKELLPKSARGIVINDSIPNVISEGITKVGGISEQIKFIDKFYPMDIESIQIENKLIKR